MRLVIAADELKDRGGDRRSEAARSKAPNGALDRAGGEEGGKSAKETAAKTGVHFRKVERIRRLKQEVPEAFEAVKEGKMSIAQAERQMRLEALLVALARHLPPERLEAVIAALSGGG
jgi:hypothetical protein